MAPGVSGVLKSVTLCLFSAVVSMLLGPDGQPGIHLGACSPQLGTVTSTVTSKWTKLLEVPVCVPLTWHTETQIMPEDFCEMHMHAWPSWTKLA